MSLLLSLLLAVAPAHAACGSTPCGTPVTAPAPQASAEGATHLAAITYSKVLKLERTAKTKADKADVEELRREAKRYAEMTAAQAARHSREIRALADRVDSLDRRLRTVEARQTALVVGAGVDVRVGPEIADVYHGPVVPYVLGEVELMFQDRRSGWGVTGTLEWNPGLRSFGGGGYVHLYARGFGIPRTALGGFVGGEYLVYDQGSTYEAYKAVAMAGPYARVTLGKKGRDDLATFVTLRPAVYVGQAATSSSAAPEVGGTFTMTLQAAKFWD